MAGQVDFHEPRRPLFRGWPKQFFVADEGTESVAIPNEVVRVLFRPPHLHNIMCVMFITAIILSSHLEYHTRFFRRIAIFIYTRYNMSHHVCGITSFVQCHLIMHHIQHIVQCASYQGHHARFLEYFIALLTNSVILVPRCIKSFMVNKSYQY